MPAETRIDRMARLLSDRIGLEEQVVSTLLDEQPFRRRLPRQQALDWWKAHRYDSAGQALAAAMKPLDLLELDKELNRQAAQQQIGGTVPSAATEEGGGPDGQLTG